MDGDAKPVGVVVSAKKGFRPFRRMARPNGLKPQRNKLLLAIILSLLVGGCALFTGWLVYDNMSKNNQNKEASNQKTKVITASINNVSKGNYGRSEQELQDYLARYPKATDKYDVLATLGSVQYISGKKEQALETLLAAEKIKGINTGTDVTSNLAAIYEQKGNNTKATEYYKKVIARSKATPDTGDDALIPQVEMSIKRLGGGQ